jgi:GNAT superfamily N-acetyltransferase
MRPFDLTLKDGGRAHFRPVTKDDKARLQKGLEHLSEASRYLRFFTPIQQLSQKELEFLTEVDQDQHVAWGAEDSNNPAFPGFGIARFVRLESDPQAAELAVTVIDAYQSRGLGTLLVALMYELALKRGIRVLQGEVHPQNQKLLVWFRKLGATTRYDEGLMHAELRVTDPFEPLSGTGEHFEAALKQIRATQQIS